MALPGRHRHWWPAPISVGGLQSPTLGAHTHAYAHGFWVGMDAILLFIGGHGWAWAKTKHIGRGHWKSSHSMLSRVRAPNHLHHVRWVHLSLCPWATKNPRSFFCHFLMLMLLPPYTYSCQEDSKSQWLEWWMLEKKWDHCSGELSKANESRHHC